MVVMESGVCLVSTISTKFNLIWFSGIGRKNLSIIKHYTKHMLNSGKIYSHKILGNIYVEHRGKIYLHTILGNMLCWTLWEDLFTQNTRGILHVEHCGKISFHKLLGNTVGWAQWEDLFTQITGEYFMLSTVWRFIYTKYWEIFYVEHCRNIYLHTILGNTLCWVLWEDLFTKNTEEYCMLSIVGKFTYTKYWGILYVEHCGKIIYTKYLGILYVEQWEDLFAQNTEEYFLLNTMGIFIYI